MLFFFYKDFSTDLTDMDRVTRLIAQKWYQLRNDRKGQKEQRKMHVQLSVELNVHTPREFVTFLPSFTTSGGWGLDHLSQVTISPSPPGVDEKFVDYTLQRLKRCGLKSSVVKPSLGLNVWRTVTRIKCGWTKRQGTLKRPWWGQTKLDVWIFLALHIS